MSDEQQQGQQVVFSNDAQLMSQNFVQMRLDTRQLLKDVEVFLSSQKTVIKKDEAGNFYEDYLVMGKPLANEEGVINILNIVLMSLMNNHIVQGNLEREEYQNLMVNTRKELTDNVVVNSYNWGIDGSKLNLIIDTIMRFYRLFISRTINNEERKSYMQQFISRETHSHSQSKNLLKDFAGGIKS